MQDVARGPGPVARRRAATALAAAQAISTVTTTGTSAPSSTTVQAPFGRMGTDRSESM
ncbi:hypothetical protein GCM10027447_19590 [Glycomyces halotolerans]